MSDFLKMLPCPKCHKKHVRNVLMADSLDYDHKYWATKCDACGHVGLGAETPEDAIRNWNKNRVDEDDLKPCPFCGGKAYFNYEYNGSKLWSVNCSKCDAWIPLYITPEEAAEHWNGRVKDGNSKMPRMW